jgi:hypothetical protein
VLDHTTNYRLCHENTPLSVAIDKNARIVLNSTLC